jgi:hypothetical protein
MKSTRNSSLCIIILALCSCFAFTGCTSYTADSSWCNGDVHIDGIDEEKEWGNAKYFFEYEDVSLGIKNDDQYLYLIFSTHDRNKQVQLVAQGLTIWVNEKGGSNKTLGIHFPIGFQGDSKDAVNDRSNISAQEYDRDFQQRLLAATQFIGIISASRKTRTRFTPRELDSLGIKAVIGFFKGTIVYELQIPLLYDETRKYGISTQKRQTIGIGLDSPISSIREIPDSQRKGQGGPNNSNGGRTGGRPGGMGSEGGEGGSGGMSGDRGGISPKANKPLELWLKVNLAEKML